MIFIVYMPTDSNTTHRGKSVIIRCDLHTFNIFIIVFHIFLCFFLRFTYQALLFIFIQYEKKRLVSEAQEKRSEEHTSELQSRFDLVCRLLLEKKNHHHK